MFPFISLDVPDQFYRLFTSLCLHAGILHLAITIAFQHIYLADLERLIGPIRTAIVYIGSGIAGNLTSAIFVPYKPEVSLFVGKIEFKKKIGWITESRVAAAASLLFKKLIKNAYFKWKFTLLPSSHSIS